MQFQFVRSKERMHGTYHHGVEVCISNIRSSQASTQALSIKVDLQIPSNLDLEQLVLKSHIALWLKTNTCTEDVGESSALLGKSIDDWRSRRSQRSLEHVAENAQNTVELGEVLGSGTLVAVSLPLDTSHHLSDDNKINDQRGSKKRVLADVEHTEFISIELKFIEKEELTRWFGGLP